MNWREWMTIREGSGATRAECQECDWKREGDGLSIAPAAARHVKKTRHKVVVTGTEVFLYDPLPQKEKEKP